MARVDVIVAPRVVGNDSKTSPFGWNRFQKCVADLGTGKREMSTPTNRAIEYLSGGEATWDWRASMELANSELVDSKGKASRQT
ncbi:hypothetical protein [Kibdelosporangium persicum]|uniref:hypothetical protein n=1 Tax=Kibdelosporangium persicum TaxID=2698649 RepID=UPI001564C75A|nr:hypothetical protein [Kibdelosporangium persicum]